MSNQSIRGYKTFQKFKWAGMFLSGISVFIMMLYTTVDVLLRNIFGISILYAYEFSQFYLMPLAVFPALAYAYGEGMMPRLNFLVVKIKERYQLFVTIFLIIIEIIIMVLLAVFGWQYLIQAIVGGQTFTAGTSYFPLSFAIVFVSIGFLLVGVEMFFLLIKNIKYKKPTFTVIEKEPNIENISE